MQTEQEMRPLLGEPAGAHIGKQAEGLPDMSSVGKTFEENMISLLPHLRERAREANEKMKRAMNSQLLELPLDYNHFALINAIVTHPDLRRTENKLESLPSFVSTFVKFNEKMLHLHDKIMGPNFSEEFVWQAIEALIAEQVKFRDCAEKVGVELEALIEAVSKRCRKTKRGALPAIVLGSVAGSLGIAALAAGLVLAPFTAGISIALPAVVALISGGAALTAGGAASVGIGARKHFEAVSLGEALDALREFEVVAETVINAFNTVSEEFGEELIVKLMQQSGLTCPICLDVVSEECRIVYYDDDDEVHEIYCADCIAVYMARSTHPVSPITRKQLTEDMLVRERGLIKRVRAFRAQMEEATGVVCRFREECKRKASLRQPVPEKDASDDSEKELM